MTARLARLVTVLLMPFALASCVLTPGKFVSTLRIDANRHFAFTYTGEVFALDLGGKFAEGMQSAATKAKPTPGSSTQDAAQEATDKAAAREATDAKNRAIAAALAKEVGYRRVEYLGAGKFSIDYAVAGTLDRGYVWPFNLDAEIVFPFIALEVRGNDTVRVKAPAFATDNDATKGLGDLAGAGAAGGASGKLPSQLDGVFTLDTDAEIVSQNNEEGVVKHGARTTVTWKATPTSKDAPTAVLRFK